MHRKLNNCYPPSLAAHNFVYQCSFYNAFFLKSCTFSHQALTKNRKLRLIARHWTGDESNVSGCQRHYPWRPKIKMADEKTREVYREVTFSTAYLIPFCLLRILAWILRILRGNCCFIMSANPLPLRLPPMPKVADLLRVYGLAAKKQLSQNFILDLNITGRETGK